MCMCVFIFFFEITEPTEDKVHVGPPRDRAVIDIGDIDVSLKMSFDIDIDIENVDIDILELVVTTVFELASLTTNTLKSINHSETM